MRATHTRPTGTERVIPPAEIIVTKTDVTPSYAPTGQPIGYHSSRRRPDPRAVATVREIYGRLVWALTNDGARHG